MGIHLYASACSPAMNNGPSPVPFHVTAPSSATVAAVSAGGTVAAAAGWKDEFKELGAECARVVIGLAATVIASKLVWHFVNPWRQDEERAEASRKYATDRLGDKLAKLETDSYENQIAALVVLPEDLNVGFDDIAGLQTVKQRLIEAVILPFSRPDLFAAKSLSGPPKGVLLYGPPGTGKTMLAKAIACETKATFFNVELSSLQSQWFGESQHLLNALFSLARKLEPSIIFLDEIDSFGRTRRDDDHQVVSDMRAEFMSCWDGFGSDATRVLVLGTTNRMWAIDPAIQRRLPRQFEVNLPELQHREDILRVLLRNEKLEPSFDFSAVSRSTSGYSGSDLKELACAALNAPIRDYLTAESARASGSEHGDVVLRDLCTGDLLQAKESVKPPVENMKQYRDMYGEDAPGACDTEFSDAQQFDFNDAVMGLMAHMENKQMT